MSSVEQRYSLLLEEEAVVNASIAAVLHLRKVHAVRKQRRKARRQWWSRPWLLRRTLYGQYERLMHEMEREDIPGFKNFLRVDPELFYELLDRITPRIEHQDTFFRKALEPGLRLAITLRYMATGDSYKSLEYGFRVANNSISRIVPETCEAIYQEYKDELLECPSTPEEWKLISDKFASRWNFQNTVGALDGKHIAIKCPSNAGSLYYNYKGFHSVIMLALVDADYKFMYLDIGANGRCSDAGVFGDSSLCAALQDGSIGLPRPSNLLHGDTPVPYFIVADDAFPMRTWLQKPYPQRLMTREERIFNYRLSRARRVVENAFGILAHRFRCLLGTFQQAPERVSSIVLACCVLHNLMRIRYPLHHANLLDKEDPSTHEVIPGLWRDDQQLLGLEVLHGNNTTRLAKQQRDYLRRYYNSPVGRVEWQDRMI